MMVGKTGHGPACKQSEINALMIKLAKAGKRVVRLKGGDPMIFGRAGEEIAACRAANIPVEVVPGISAAQGAAVAPARLADASRAGAPRCNTSPATTATASCPPISTGAALADPAATTIVYMPKKTLRELSARAIAQGLDPSTPAVAVANATRPDETIVAATIGDIAERIEAIALDGPVLVMIGRVLASAIAQEQQRRTERARRIAICVGPKREAAVSARQHTRPVLAASVNARLTAREGTLKRPRRR